MIQTLKGAILGGLNRLGAGEMLARTTWRRHRVLILCYHGISLADEHEWQPGLYIPPHQLERDLRLLRDLRCAVLPLGEAVERLYRRDLPERAVVLTFDDGYYDFLARAWPLLERYGCPATVYLTTFRVDHNLPIPNLFLPYVLWRAQERVLEGSGIAGLRGRYPLRTAADREEVVRQISHALSTPGAARLPRAERSRDRITREIALRLDLDYDALLRNRVLTLLRPEEVSHLSQRGADFQLHTHSHCTPADAAEFVRDVLVNADRIEALTGARPTHLCYPSGNYRPEYLPLLRAHGMRSATTCDPGIAAPTTDPLLLPRFVETGTVHPVLFESWVTGLACCLPRRTRRGGYAVPPESPANRALVEVR
jgi:peptidoglycan/xylan/chitin deacetylase (PgdA/CDA1 family)